MLNPYKTNQGNTYEKYAIKKWLLLHRTDPLTNIVMTSTAIIPNIILSNIIKEWREKLCVPANS